MAPALTEAGQSQNFALTSSNCSPIGIRNGGSVGVGVEGEGGPRVRRADGPGVNGITEAYVTCKRSLIGADGNGVDETAFENLTTLAIASELLKVNKASNAIGSHVVNGHTEKSVNGGGTEEFWNTSGMSRNIPEDPAGDADGNEETESLPLSTDDLGQNVRDLLEVIQGMEKTEGSSEQDPFGSDRKSSVNQHDHGRANEGSIFSSSNHDSASTFDLQNGPVDGMYPVTDLDCNLSSVDMISMCVVELPGSNTGNGMSSGTGALLESGSLGVGGNPGLLDGGGLDSQLALDSHLAEDGLCVSREALSGEKMCEVQRRQAEVERKIERLLRRLGKLQARRMGRHAAEELRVVVEHAKKSLVGIAGGSAIKGSTPAGSRRVAPPESSNTQHCTDAGKRAPFLASYVQDVASDAAAGLRIASPTSTAMGGDNPGSESAGETVVKTEDVRNLPTAALESLALKLDRSGAGKLTKRYFGSGSPRARLEEVVEGAVAAAEAGLSKTEEVRRRQRRRRRFGEWGVEEEEGGEECGGGRRAPGGGAAEADDERRRRRRPTEEEGGPEERLEVRRDGDLKVVVVKRGVGGGWGCGVGTKEAEVEEAFGKLGAQLRVVERGIDSDATASSSGAESADETVSGYSASAAGTLSIGRRSAWKWAQERAWVGSRWTWLQAQISDLEYRIRQHSEIHRQIRASKGPLVFAKPAEQGGHPPAQTVVVNGFHHVDMGKEGSCSSVAVGGGDGETSCRIRPLRSLPRKRRLLRASDPGGVGGNGGGKKGRAGAVSPPSKAAEVLCTGCHQSPLRVPPCVLCTAPRRGQNAPSLSTPRAPPPSSLPVSERVARVDPSFHPILSFTRDIGADIHIGAIMKTQSWQQDVLSEKGKPSLTSLSSGGSVSLGVGRGGGTAAGLARRRRGGCIGGARRGRRPAVAIRSIGEQDDGSPMASTEFGVGMRGTGTALGARRRNYASFRIKKVSANALSSRLRHKLAKGRRGRGRMGGGNHCDPLQRLKQKRLKAAMALQSACEDADEQLRMELGLPSSGSASAPGTAPPSPFPPASPASPGSTSPPHHSSASSSSSTSSTSHHHHHSPYSPSSSSIAPGSCSIGPGGERKASMLHDLLSRRKRENSYDIDNIVIPYSVAASTRVEKLPYKEILTPKWRVVEPYPSPKKFDSGDNGVVRRSSHESEEEDVSAEAVVERHERCEQEERKRFLRLLRRPHGANSGKGDAKSQGIGRGGQRRGRADSKAESSGQNTPDPMSPDHPSACPSPLPLSAANSPPPTPLPLPPLLEENAPLSPEAATEASIPSPAKSSQEVGSLLGKPSDVQPSSAEASKCPSLEAVVPSPLKGLDGRTSSESSPFKVQGVSSKVNSLGSKGGGSKGEGGSSLMVAAGPRRRTVSLSYLHPMSASSGRERCPTPIEPYDEYPQPKPFEPYVFPLSDEHYKALLSMMPPGHRFPPACPLQSQPPSHPSSQASSTNGDGPAEGAQPSHALSPSRGSSVEQNASAPRSPCSETTESVLEEDDRGEDDLDQGDPGPTDDPDWTLDDEVRVGRGLKR